MLFHPAASVELDEAIDFYEERQPGLGLDLKQEILHGISSIADAPDRWPAHRHGTRKYLLHRFPFHIFYLSLSDCIWIVAVAHCSRKPDYWKERLN